MKNRISIILALFLSIAFVLPLGCKKETPEPEASETAAPVLKYYSNPTGNPSHIGVVAKLTQADTDQELYVYGGYDASGVPNSSTSAVLKDNANGSKLNYLMNNDGKPAYCWFDAPDGTKDTILYYFNYFTETDYVVTVYDHDWITDANVMLYQADVKLVNGKPEITKTYSLNKQASSLTFDPRDLKLGKTAAITPQAFSAIGDATRTIIGIGTITVIGITCPYCLGAGIAIGLLWPDDSNASEPDPDDLQDPSTINPPSDPGNGSSVDPNTNPTTSTTTSSTTSTPTDTLTTTTSTPTTTTSGPTTTTTSTPSDTLTSTTSTTTSTPTTSTTTSSTGPDTLHRIRNIYPWR